MARLSTRSTMYIRSQSAASRHLEHLAATGYLIMRGDKRANLYRLNPDQIDRTFNALKTFCQ